MEGAALEEPELEKVCERIDAGSRDIRIVHQVELGVEVRAGIAPLDASLRSGSE